MDVKFDLCLVVQVVTEACIVSKVGIPNIL